MSQWLNHVLERASTVDDWLSPVRAQALDTLKQQQWPTRRTEAWRYTSLHPVADLQLQTGTSNNTAEAPFIEGLNSLDLVFVDGQLSTDISKLQLPEGVTISERFLRK